MTQSNILSRPLQITTALTALVNSAPRLKISTKAGSAGSRCTERNTRMKSSAFLAIALVALALFGAQPSSASHLEVGINYAYVSKVNVSKSGTDSYIHIAVAPSDFSPAHGCQNRAFARSKDPTTDEQTKALLAIALQSFQTKQQVHVWTQGCTGGSWLGYPVITRMQVQQPPHTGTVNQP